VWAHLQDLSRKPNEQNHPSVPLELRISVKNKIHSQDAKLRKSLSALDWTLEDPSSIRLVCVWRLTCGNGATLLLVGLLMFNGNTCAQYILQVAFLMSECLLQIIQACCTVTLDLREWERLTMNFRAIRDLFIKRVDFLKGSSSWIIDLSSLIISLDFIYV
jgi:hypothetical protein